MCNWLLRMERGEIVGLFCADVSGAFVRIDQYRFGSKLRASGLHPQVVAFLENLLEDRISPVVMGGAARLQSNSQTVSFKGLS